MPSPASATSRFQKECSRVHVQARSTSVPTRCLKTSAQRHTSRGVSTCPPPRATLPCQLTVQKPPSGRTRRHDPQTLRTMRPAHTLPHTIRTRHHGARTSRLIIPHGRSPLINPRWAIAHPRSLRTPRIRPHPPASCRRFMIRVWLCIAIPRRTRSPRLLLRSLELLLGRSLRH